MDLSLEEAHWGQVRSDDADDFNFLAQFACCKIVNSNILTDEDWDEQTSSEIYSGPGSATNKGPRRL
jgi:hypothetical protein